MSTIQKLKFIAFLSITQLIVAPITFAAIKTTELDGQDNALMDNSTLAGNTDMATIISLLIKTALGFLGVIFLVLTIMSGFKWMMAQGNEEDIKKAKGTIKNSIIGLVIVIAAYAITYSIFNYLPFASNNSGTGGIIAG